MAQLRAQAELGIARPAGELYAVIADYAGRHRNILPAAYHDYTAEVTADGASTIARWVLHVGNHRRPYTMQVDPSPRDQSIVERDQASSFTTEWRVLVEGSGCRVRLASTWQQRSHGFPALFGRIFAPRTLARLHAETLRRLVQEAAVESVRGR
jgi:hypothetical protein